MSLIAAFDPSQFGRVVQMFRFDLQVAWDEVTIEWNADELRFHFEGSMFGRAIRAELGIPVRRLGAGPGRAPFTAVQFRNLLAMSQTGAANTLQSADGTVEASKFLLAYAP